MHRLRLAAAGLWWRRWSSLTVLLVATVTVTAAVVGPLYARAAAESVLRSTLVRAPVQATGLHLQTTADVTQSDPFSALRSRLPATVVADFPRVVPSLQVGSSLLPLGQPADTVVTTIVYRAGFCAHVQVIAGHCPQGPNQVMVSQRAATGGYGLHLGHLVELTGLPGAAAGVQGATVARISGFYRPIDLGDPYWFGLTFFNAHPGSGANGNGPDTIDSVFVDQSAFSNAVPGTTSSVWLDYYLDPSRVTLGNEGKLRAAVAAAQLSYPATAVPGLTTQLPAILGQADTARGGLGVGTTLVTLQLVLLAWLVLFQVVAAAAEARGTEVAVAKLRGLRPGGVVSFGLAEPVLLLVLATPLGLGCGLLAAHLLGRIALLPGVPVGLTTGGVLAAVSALAAGLLAAALASRPMLARSVLSQWRRAEERVGRSRLSVSVDVAVAAGAVAALLVLRGQAAVTGHRAQTSQLLGPALLFVAVALLGTRLLPLLGRLGARWTRATRWVGAFLAVRQLARRQTGLRFAALLAVTIGLATFAVAATTTVRANQLARARSEVGAERVVAVQPAGRQDLVVAVDRADPTGRWAMAAASWAPFGGSLVGTVEAVDASRLRAVADRGAGVAPLAQLTRLIAPPSLHTEVTSGTLVLTLAVTGHLGSPAPNLVLSLVDAEGRTATFTGPPVHPGTRTYAMPIRCQGRCQLVDVQLDRNALDTDTMTGSFSLTGLGETVAGRLRAVAGHLGVLGSWTGGAWLTQGHDTVTVTAAGVRDDFVAVPGGWPSIEVTSLTRMPVVVTPFAVNPAQLPLKVDNQLGNPVRLRLAAMQAVLPRALNTGALANLETARVDLPDFAAIAQDEVWLGPRAPADALARLRAAGLLLGRVDSVSAHVTALRQQGPALALQLLLFSSGVAALLALMVTGLALAAAGRRRSFELAALLAVGVRRRALLRGCVLEQGLLLGAGLVLGVVPALVAVAVALPSIPEFAGISPVPLSYRPDAGVVAIFITALAVVVLAVAVVGGSGLVRAAVPARLREAAP